VSIGAAVAHNRLGVNGDGPDADGDGITIAASVNGRDGISGVTSLTSKSLNATAKQSASVTAAVAATAAAIGWEALGKVGVSASGAGADATNTVKQTLSAEVIGRGEGSTLTIKGAGPGNPGLINLSADDTSTLSTTATGAALAFSFAPGVSVAPAVGVSLADNTLIRNQLAQLQGFSVGGGTGGVHTSGDIQVQSTSSGTIETTSVAVAIAASIGENSVGLAGGGAQSFNTVLGASQALIGDSDLGETSGTKASNVDVIANDTSTIHSEVDAIAASISGGVTGSTASAAIGVALSRNFIGEQQGNSAVSGGHPIVYSNPVRAQDGATVQGNLLQAGIWGSNLYLQGNLTIKAEQTSRITSTVDSFAAALAAAANPFGEQQPSALTVSGSGAEASNRSLQTILASLESTPTSAIPKLQAAAVDIQANDQSRIEATAWGAAIGANYGGLAAGSGTIGVALARNTLNNHIESRLSHLSGEANSLAVTASKDRQGNGDQPTIKATSAAVSLGVTFSEDLAVSLAGGGADAINTILGDVLTSLDYVKFKATGTAGITIDSSGDQQITAGVGAGVGAGSFAPRGGSVAVGAVKVQNLIGVSSDDKSNRNRAAVRTSVANSELTTSSANADLKLTSSSTSSYDALAVPVVVALTTGNIAAAGSGAFNFSRSANAIATEAHWPAQNPNAQPLLAAHQARFFAPFGIDGCDARR
jgi:hypothetical protein